MNKTLVVFLGLLLFLGSFGPSRAEAITITPQDHTRVISFLLENRLQVVEWLVAKGEKYEPNEIDTLNQILRMKGIDKQTHQIVVNALEVMSAFKKADRSKIPKEVSDRVNLIISKTAKARSVQEMLEVLEVEKRNINRQERKSNLGAAIDFGIAMLRDGEKSIYDEQNYTFLENPRATRSHYFGGLFAVSSDCCDANFLKIQAEKKKGSTAKKHAVEISGADVGGAVTGAVGSWWTGPISGAVAGGLGIAASSGVITYKIWVWAWS